MTQKSEMSARALKMEELEMVNGGKKKHHHYDDPWVPDIYRKNPLAPRI